MIRSTVALRLGPSSCGAALRLLIVLLVQADVTRAAPFVVETDAATSSYAASLMYDDAADRIYLTGSTYGGKQSFFHVDETLANENGYAREEEETEEEQNEDALMSDCFIGILQVPRGDRAPEWLRRVAIGVPGQSESCADLFTYRQGNNRKLLLTGHVIGGASVLQEQQEMFSSSSSGSSSNATVSGMILDLTWWAEVKTGYLMDRTAVQYPVAVVADERATANEDIYVATLQSTVGEVNPAFTVYQENDVDENVQELDLTTSGGYLPPAFGNQYSVLLQRLGRRASTESELLTIASEGYGVDRNANGQPSSANLLALKAVAGLVDMSSAQAQSYDQYRYVTEPLEERWEREFIADESSVQVSTLLHLKGNSSNVVVIAGSTRGSGTGLGEATDYSMSGFITVVDATIGLPLRTRRLSSSATSSDHILGLCQDTNNNLYAVGMSNGKLSTEHPSVGIQSESTFQAFIQKMSAENLRVIWTRTLAAETDSTHPGSIHGMSCAVTPDGSHVYLAGTVKAGAAITLDGKTMATKSAGHDDIFVAQYESVEGNLRFVKQLGTNRNDQLAAGRGAVCDKYGNVILLANTQGSFLKPDEKVDPFVNNVVVLSVDRVNGDHADLTDAEGKPRTIPTPKKEDPNPDSANLDGDPSDAIPLSQQIEKYLFSSETQFLIIVGLFVVAAMITLVTTVLYFYRRRSSSRKEKRFPRSLSSEDVATTQQKRLKIYDPESASPVKPPATDDAASTDVEEEDDYYFHDAATTFSSQDALMPLSTPADEAGSDSYQESLRRLERVEQEESPKHSNRKRSDTWNADASKIEDRRSLLPKQKGDDLLERWLKSDR